MCVYMSTQIDANLEDGNSHEGGEEVGQGTDHGMQSSHCT